MSGIVIGILTAYALALILAYLLAHRLGGWALVVTVLVESFALAAAVTVCLLLHLGSITSAILYCLAAFSAGVPTRIYLLWRFEIPALERREVERMNMQHRR